MNIGLALFVIFMSCVMLSIVAMIMYAALRGIQVKIMFESDPTPKFDDPEMRKLHEDLSVETVDCSLRVVKIPEHIRKKLTLSDEGWKRLKTTFPGRK